MTDGKKNRILCIGIPVRDLTFNVQAVPGRGQKFNADRFAQICGGNALNAAIGISRLGGKASLTGPMGDAGETSSQYIFEDLAKEGIALASGAYAWIGHADFRNHAGPLG